MYIQLLADNQSLLQAFGQGNGVLFIGEGVSVQANLPSQEELFRPLAQQLGIHFDQNRLLDVPQYYVNHHPKGRTLLNDHLVAKLSCDESTFAIDHEYIAQLPVRIIITTNSDTLLEHALTRNGIDHSVITNDADLEDIEQKNIILIKLLGCITKPESLVVTRDDIASYVESHPNICALIPQIVDQYACMCIGFDFSHPSYNLLARIAGINKAKHIWTYVALQSNQYEIADKKQQGVEIINLEVVDKNNPVELAKFLEVFSLDVVRQWKLHATAHQAVLHNHDPLLSDNLRDLLTKRLGTGLSLVPKDSEQLDSTHKYELLFRQDLLDYPTGDFYSIRRIKGINDSNALSSYIQYSESSEQKVSFLDTKVQAYDTISQNSLMVKSVESPNQKFFTHVFKIFFPHPIAPNEAFDITYCIRLPGELNVLNPENEVMSIALTRIAKPIGLLEFNVVLNFKPRTFRINATDRRGNQQEIEKNALVCELYTPQTEMEKILGITWSSTPYIIRWKCLYPSKSLYIIHYLK